MSAHSQHMQMSKNAVVKGQVGRAGVGAPPQRIAVVMQLCVTGMTCKQGWKQGWADPRGCHPMQCACLVSFWVQKAVCWPVAVCIYCCLRCECYQVLMVATSHDKLGDSGKPTGLWW